ncbi:IST1 homolog isoform X2 [Punica granatum]|uniref:IST1 homolog isoform X2 n=1 Tax=Punica granatum TaxID=22663 RepID=A0A6P8E9Z4_PUNGR|nr:IST1 homolog isoform X2 [Punica granatum]
MLLQNKRDLQLKLMRKEIAQFLQAGQEAIARIRVEHVIREQNLTAAYAILELFCEFIHARIPIIESQRECPAELREAIASIIFAAPRCSDVPDLLLIKNLFMTKYGKEFVLAAAELRPDSGVNRELIEKLSISAPSADVRLRVLKDIAREYNLDWDSSKTEAELSKKHEDLLGGSKQMHDRAPPGSPQKRVSFESSSSNGTHSALTVDSNQNIPPKTISKVPNEIKSSSRNDDVIVSKSKSKTERRPESSEILERARAAIASAERASAAARAAAELAKIQYGPRKFEGKS